MNIKPGRGCRYRLYAGITLFVLAAISAGRVSAQQSRSAKPNIIFILVDDQGYGDLGVFFQNQRAKAADRGKPWEYSPQLDRLAAGGAVLTQYYSAAPVCAPSRASLMLGESQGHANVRDNQFDKALENNYNMASTLRQLGYSTAIVGKWGLQGDKRFDGPEGKNWPAHPLKRGFDFFYGYMRHSDGHEHYPKEGLYDGPKEVWENYTNVVSGLDKCYTADLWTAVAKKYITDHEKKDADKPFFLYLAYDTPHAVDELPTQAYPKGGGLHGGLQWTGEPGHMINTASGRPDSWIYPDYAGATYDNDHNAATPEVPWPDTYKRYATANRRIDDGVGDIMQLLRDLKIDSNTVIVYTSDNGPSVETYLKKEKWEEKHLPVFFGSFGPFDGIKRDNWEGGIRMPAIVSWPGHIPAGKVVSTPCIAYDLAPTFTAMAGTPAPAGMDGSSLLPLLTGTGTLRSRPIYIEYYVKGKTPDFTDFAPGHRGRQRNQMQTIRLGDYVGVRYDIKTADDDFEIYNVVKDPGQRHNLATGTGRLAGGRSVAALQQQLKAAALQARRPDTDAARPYDSALIPAVDVKVRPGISWESYSGHFSWIPQVAGLQPAATGRSAYPGADNTRAGSLLYFEGYIRVPEDGAYTFFLDPSARAVLRIHDAKVIDADYPASAAHSGSLLLKAGLHPFRLYYVAGGDGLPHPEWSGPGIQRQRIPAGVFFRKR